MSAEINLERVAELLASTVAKDRQQAVVAVVRAELAQFIPQITEMAGNDVDEETRFLARKALERLVGRQKEQPDEGRFAQMPVEQLLAHEDPHARFYGLKKLLAAPNRTGRILLQNALNTETVLQLKASMIIGLGKFANPEDIVILVPFLKHEDARIRANTVEALAMIECEDSFRYIIGCMADEDNRVKTNVVKALQGIGGQSLFNLLKTMSQDEKLWTRASAAYAFYRIKSPQSLVLLAQMVLNDPAPEVRQRALEYIQAEKKEGNPAAAVVLENLEKSQSHDEFVAALPEEHAEHSADQNLEQLLASEDAAKRYIALSRINSDEISGVAGILLDAFNREQDAFLLSMMLTMVRAKKMVEGFERSSQLLGHADDRVRANAVEAVAAALPAGASLDCLVPLLKDNYSRVVANALLALYKYNRVEIVAEIKGMLSKGREAFKRSALYVISQLREPVLVPILGKLLRDYNPRVRDNAFKILQDYSDARVSGAIILFQDVKKQIELEKSKDRFFENSLDQVFAGVLRLLRSVGGDNDAEIGKKLFKRNVQAEKLSLLQLGQKCLQNKIVDARTMETLTAIDVELKHIEELSKNTSLESSDGSIADEVRQKSEQELLKIEQQSLKNRKEALLTFLAFEVYSNRNHLDSRSASLLMADLGRVEASLCSYIPQHGFSMLPEEGAAVSEFFDVAMRLYQKHVAAFSIYTLMQLGRWLLISFVHFVIFALLTAISKPLAVIYAVIVIPYMAYKTLGIMVEWKINVALMVDDGIHGRVYNRERIRDKAIELYGSVFSSSIQKHLKLGLWFVLALIPSFVILVAGNLAKGSTLVADLANMLAMILLISIFASAYFKYLLVEPAAILEPDRDAFETSEKLFLRNKVKLATLFLFSTFIIQLVTGTSVEIVSLISGTLPALIGVILVVGLSLISDLCLAPIVFSTLCIYSLVNLKKMR